MALFDGSDVGFLTTICFDHSNRFWNLGLRIAGYFLCRHIAEPRVQTGHSQMCCTWPADVRYFDCARSKSILFAFAMASFSCWFGSGFAFVSTPAYS